MIRAIIFDLDGTLTDTLEDLWRSTNYALQSCGMPERTLDEVRQFVGNGVRNLMLRAVPTGTSDEKFERCFSVFKAYYIVHCQDHTYLYPGVRELLQELGRRGYRLAVVSNKLQSGVSELEQKLFPNLVEVALGEQSGIRRKPAPDMVNHALEQLQISPSEAIYVGDSDVDIDTAYNSGLPCISVLWGFRNREFLLAHGATCIVEKPSEILQLIGLN